MAGRAWLTSSWQSGVSLAYPAFRILSIKWTKSNLDDLSVADRLSDLPRSGKPVRITDEQVCRMVELACEAPERSGRPISQWTAREIADEEKQRGIVETISARHAARLLKRGRSNHTAGDT